MKTVKIGEKLYPIKGLLTVAGAAILLSSLSVDFSYANLNTYVISYLRQDDNAITYADWSYISTTKIGVTGVIMPFAGNLTRKMRLKTSVVIGSAIFSLGYLLTGLALDSGLVPVVFSIGVCHGVGFTLTYAQVLGAVMEWFPSDTGIMSGIAIAGYGFGGMIWNPLETKFTNPDNIGAESVHGQEDKYFVDPKVLDNVPNMFYLLGGVFVALQLVSLALLAEPSKTEEDEIQKLTDSQTSLLYKVQEKRVYSVKPTDVLKTKEFYKLWIIFFSITIATGFFGDYSKAFGQLYISDDNFFSIVAIFCGITNGFCRIVWGKVYDKKGFQFALVLIGGLCSALSFSFVDLSAFEPDSVLAKVFYSFWIVSTYFLFPGVYACIAPETRKAFGQNHYSANFGLLFTVNVAYTIIALVLIQTLFDVVGYQGMFFFAGACGMLGMGVTFTYPDIFSSDHYIERFGEEPQEPI